MASIHTSGFADRLRKGCEMIPGPTVESDAVKLRSYNPNMNATAPIARLPTEILTEIFTLSAAYNSTSSQDTARTWIIMTHVCRVWRDIVLAYPQPWADHVCTFPSARDVFLGRAQETPLTLHIREEDVHGPPRKSSMVKRDTFAERLDFCIKHLPRAKRLYLYLTEKFGLYRSILSALSNATLPYLELIEAECDEVLLGRYAGHCATNHLIAPNLRRVHLCNCIVPWDPRAVFDLELTETEDKLDDEEPLQLETLLDLLRESVRLQSLHISADIQLDSATLPLKPTNRLTLPHLRHLRVSNFAKQCLHFLSYITPTPLTSISLSVAQDVEDEEPEHGETIGRLLTLAGKHLCLSLKSGECPLPTAVSLWSGEYRVFSPMTPLFNATGLVPLSPYRSPAFQAGYTPVFYLDCSGEGQEDNSWLDDIVSVGRRISAELSLSSSHITALEIDINFDPAKWGELCTLFPNVHTLHVGKHGMHRNLPSLSSNAESEGIGLRPSLWPRLSVIHLHSSLLWRDVDGLLYMIQSLTNLGVGIEHLIVSEKVLFSYGSVEVKEGLFDRARNIVPELVCL